MGTYGIFETFLVILGTVPGCNQSIGQLGPMAIWRWSLKEPLCLQLSGHSGFSCLAQDSVGQACCLKQPPKFIRTFKLAKL